MSKPGLKRMSKKVYKTSLFQESVPFKTAFQKQWETQVKTHLHTFAPQNTCTHTPNARKIGYILFFY